MANVNTAVLTYEDYRNAPDDERYELLAGQLVMIAAPNIAHQIVGGELFGVLRDFVKKGRLGRVFSAPTDVVLSDTNVVQPDVIFVSKGRMSIVGKNNIQGAPDLVVEVISPSNPEQDLVRKRDIYARHGVAEYWIADPDARSMRVMILEGGAYRVAGEYGIGDTLTSSTLKGLDLMVGEVFAELDMGSMPGA